MGIIYKTHLATLLSPRKTADTEVRTREHPSRANMRLNTGICSLGIFLHDAASSLLILPHFVRWETKTSKMSNSFKQWKVALGWSRNRIFCTCRASQTLLVAPSFGDFPAHTKDAIFQGRSIKFQSIPSRIVLCHVQTQQWYLLLCYFRCPPAT